MGASFTTSPVCLLRSQLWTSFSADIVQLRVELFHRLRDNRDEYRDAKDFPEVGSLGSTEQSLELAWKAALCVHKPKTPHASSSSPPRTCSTWALAAISPRPWSLPAFTYQVSVILVCSFKIFVFVNEWMNDIVEFEFKPPSLRSAFILAVLSASEWIQSWPVHHLHRASEFLTNILMIFSRSIDHLWIIKEDSEVAPICDDAVMPESAMIIHRCLEDIKKSIFCSWKDHSPQSNHCLKTKKLSWGNIIRLP